MTGTTFRWIQANRSNLLKFVLVRGAVFARMDPDAKVCCKSRIEAIFFSRPSWLMRMRNWILCAVFVATVPMIALL